MSLHELLYSKVLKAPYLMNQNILNYFLLNRVAGQVLGLVRILSDRLTILVDQTSFKEHLHSLLHPLKMFCLLGNQSNFGSQHCDMVGRHLPLLKL